MEHDIGSHGPQNHGENQFASASATADVLKGVAADQELDQAPADIAQHNEVLVQKQQADQLFAEALDYESTQRRAWDAHIKEGLRYAPDKNQRSASIMEPGATLDLQQSSHLSDTSSERAIAHEPLIVTLRDPSGGDAIKVVYDNQTLARIPEALDESEIKRKPTASWQRHVGDQFNLPPSRTLDPAYGTPAAQDRAEWVDVHRALTKEAQGIVDDRFVESQTWSYEDSELPTTLVIGQAFGGNVAELVGLEVAEVSVPADPLQRAGKLDSESSAREYMEKPSPHIAASALLSAVREHRGRVAEEPEIEVSTEESTGGVSET